MSDTPRTDEEWLRQDGTEYKLMMFARQLERELADKEAELSEVKKKYLLVCAQHGRLVDKVYEEDGETLKQDRLNAELAKEQLWGKEQSIRAEKAEQELSLANGTIESRDRNIAEMREELERLRGELAEAKREVERLKSDLAEERGISFTLAAGQCLYVKGDETGNAYCEMKLRAEQAEARAAAAEKDAQRYRWLRDDASGALWLERNWTLHEKDTAFDAAIDTAMKEKK